MGGIGRLGGCASRSRRRGGRCWRSSGPPNGRKKKVWAVSKGEGLTPNGRRKVWAVMLKIGK